MKDMPRFIKFLILSAVLALFVVWLFLNLLRVLYTQNGLIKIITILPVSLFILFSSNIKEEKTAVDKIRLNLIFCIIGVLLSGCGIVLNLHFIQWIGILILIYIGLKYSLPSRHKDNILPALFLVFWIHPLPS